MNWIWGLLSHIEGSDSRKPRVTKERGTSMYTASNPRAMAFCRDNSKSQMPGKYVARAKSLRPADGYAQVLAKRCTKKGFRNREQAKAAIEKAKFSRILSSLDGVSNNRREIRMYECKCGRWHLTSTTQIEYDSKYEFSKKMELANAA